MARLVVPAGLTLLEGPVEPRLRLWGAYRRQERANLLAELAAREAAQKPGAG